MNYRKCFEFTLNLANLETIDKAQPSTACSGHSRVVSPWRGGMDTWRNSKGYVETIFGTESFTERTSFQRSPSGGGEKSSRQIRTLLYSVNGMEIQAAPNSRKL